MLETIIEFANERLREEFDAEATHRRLAEYFMAFAEDAEPHLTMEEQATWLDRCERERANLRVTIRWAIDAGEADVGLRMTGALWRFWQQRGPVWEGRDALDKLLALDRSAPAIRAKALSAAGGLAWWGGDYQAMQRHNEEALPLSRQSGDRHGEIRSLYDLGFATLWSGVLGTALDADRAEHLFRQSLALALELGDTKGIGKAYRGIGQVMGIAKGDPASAVPIFEKAVALFEELGDRWELNEALVALGNGWRFSGDKQQARVYYLRGLDLQVAAGNSQTSPAMLFLLSALEGELRRYERVARLWGAAESARDATGAVAPPAAQRLVGDPLVLARRAIGNAAVERALADGRSMDHDSAIAYAHEDT